MAVVILWLNLPPLDKELYIKIKENVFLFFYAKIFGFYLYQIIIHDKKHHISKFKEDAMFSLLTIHELGFPVQCLSMLHCF